MERIFLDNFRGFSDQYIDIRDVNFLVGENSSGKSSVLMALNTIFYSRFWHDTEFYSGDNQVFSFDDLVSAETEDKSGFRIGYFNDDNNEVSFLFEFGNSNGKPVINSGGIEKEKKLFIFSIEDEKFIYNIYENEKLSLGKIKNINKEEINPIEIFFTDNITPYNIFTAIKIAGEKKGINGFENKLPMKTIAAIAPIRSKPKKTYDEPGTLENPEGDHIPYIIRRIFKTKHDFFQEINNFGKKSGLFKTIEIKEYEASDDAPFRMNFVLNKEPINIVNIGYGVSQVLPILFNAYAMNSATISIQQPEVHLHPKAQAALGEIFFDLSIGKNRKKLIIETHSDYIIDRFRQKHRKSQEKSSAHVLFFLRENGINKAFSINIDDKGNYSDDQPKEFREFFINEEMENLGLQS